MLFKTMPFFPFSWVCVLFVVFFCDRRFGDDFIVVLVMLFRMTNSDFCLYVYLCVCV